MTPANTPIDAPLPPVVASAGGDGLEMTPATGAIWAALGEGFARFFPSPAGASDVGECTMDSPSL